MFNAVLTVIPELFLYSTEKKILFYSALSEDSNNIVIYWVNKWQIVYCFISLKRSNYVSQLNHNKTTSQV